MDAPVLGDDLAAEARLDDVNFYLGDPYPTYARLRKEAPVFWCEAGNFWALTKYEDIAWVEGQPNPPFTTVDGLFIPDAANPARTAERDPGGAQQAGAGFMSDPPRHTNFRRLITPAFSSKRMVDLEPSIRKIVGELLDQLPAGEPVDFVEAVSVPLAVRVVADFLGVPPQDWDDVRRWADSFMLNLGGALAAGSPEEKQAIDDLGQMYAYFVQSLAERRGNPREDLMSAVANMQVDGEFLTEQTAVAICFSVMVAGNDTTRNTLSGSMVTFAKYPDQWDRLVAEPTLIGNATEELLRFVAPVIHFGRRATEPVVIRDQPIAAGDFVVMLYGSGNRDEEIWTDPDTFDVGRSKPQRHLSFGWGLHRCIGAMLGRAEIRIALEGLIERYQRWEIAGPVERLPSTAVNQYEHLPVSLIRR
ncbi:cytochrome P450 [Mycobacterium sp. CVI_P3]|uniref:Cytochrome P450 n=1 Tax=Mycobacterium pinniadriaticum TaxID=2994102 RepID=A0ABT3SF61_9MYCO|nr:cytochrome P450 [Mycobacterium pinniadriaticum]MCX2931777.1 cytochrome P450 [Mycobacterium pinniadriaticum]MCX2938148.1 cytochrome P450 [Mycobacterium pinniadriaticum]